MVVLELGHNVVVPEIVMYRSHPVERGFQKCVCECLYLICSNIECHCFNGFATLQDPEW